MLSIVIGYYSSVQSDEIQALTPNPLSLLGRGGARLYLIQLNTAIVINL
jgi:hypothetical protein